MGIVEEQSGNGKEKVTLADVARESGVSPATVSLTLRNKPGVGYETRQRVIEAAQVLGYLVSPSPTAANTAGVNGVGLILKVQRDESMLSNYFYTPVLAGIEATCRRQHINLFYAHLPVDAHNNPIEPPRLLREQSADGLLIVGAYLNKTMLQMIQAQSAPLVLVDAYAELDEFDAVVTDNVSGAYEATRYLIDHGHRHIALVGTEPDSYPSILERRQGYLQALADAGLPPTLIDCHHHPDDAFPAVKTFLQHESKITAVLGANDEVAIATKRAVESLGKRVPTDYSIVGFDNISLTQHMTPPLTTMRIDKQGMGRLAAQLLFNRIENPGMGQTKIVIRPSLIARDSVQRLP